MCPMLRIANAPFGIAFADMSRGTSMWYRCTDREQEMENATFKIETVSVNFIFRSILTSCCPLKVAAINIWKYFMNKGKVIFNTCLEVCQGLPSSTESLLCASIKKGNKNTGVILRLSFLIGVFIWFRAAICLILLRWRDYILDYV